MKNDIRSSGIGIVGNIPWGTHFSQFCQTKEDLIEVVIPYFRAGLENNEFCLWITSDFIGTVEVKKVLKEFISDIDIYFKKGQMEIIPVTNFCLKEGIFDSQKALDDIINRANQALISGYNGIRLTVNICSLEEKKLDDFIFYEKRLNSVIGEYPIIALCTYSLEVCSPIDIIEITANHDFVLAKKKDKWEQIKNLGRKNITNLKQTENAVEVEHAKTEEISREREEERKRLLSQVVNERERLQTIIDSIDDEVWISDTEGNMIQMNPAAQRALGLQDSKSLCEIVDLLEILEPDGTPRLWENTPLLRAAKGETVSGEEIIRHLNTGELRHRRFNCAPIRNRLGNITGAVAVSKDVTEAKRVEEALRDSEARLKVAEAVEAERQRFFNMLEALPVMICLLTPDYHIAFANRAFREKFGESEGRHCYEYCFGLTKPCEFCEAYKVLETGQLHHWEVTTSQGSVIDAYDLPFTDIDGSPMILEMDIDITERRKAIETLAKIDEIRTKEIHHRIKNNLQVISSLLDLQAETFSRLKVCKVPQVVEAFMESQNRVASMALIHEELYRGKESENLDFASYLRKLTANLLNSYNPKNNALNLKLNLEEIYLDMDIAIPLGIIVNELVSNSFKYAFSNRNTKEISITLQRIENFTANTESFKINNSCKENNFSYVLRVADNGKGIPKEVDLQTVNSLGLKLVNILADQIDSCVELKRDQGTEFTILFNDIENKKPQS